MISYFDSHAHLDRFGDEAPEVIKRALDANVTQIMHIATDMGALDAGIKLQQKGFAPLRIFLAAATPPHDVKEGEEDSFFPIVRQAAQEHVLSAIGECGLDYFYHMDTKDVQREVFLRYADLALTENLPLIVHCRDAFSDFFPLLDNFSKPIRGVVHCFTGSYEDAKNLVERGWYISLSGIITYPKSTALHEVVKRIPLTSILIETDAPFLAPQAFRGKRNEPCFVVEVAKQIAFLKNITLEEVALATSENASFLVPKKSRF